MKKHLVDGDDGGGGGVDRKWYIYLYKANSSELYAKGEINSYITITAASAICRLASYEINTSSFLESGGCVSLLFIKLVCVQIPKQYQKLQRTCKITEIWTLRWSWVAIISNKHFIKLWHLHRIVWPNKLFNFIREIRDLKYFRHMWNLLLY